jgi:hypothetical protein
MTFFCFVPDNELFLEVKDAFDFSRALPVLHRVPKTESNFYRPSRPALTTFTP